MIELCNTNQGFVMALLTLVYVVATIGIVLLGRRSNKIAQANLETLVQLEQEKSRPLVDVEMLADAPFVSLKITNRGLTPAYNIEVSLLPSLKCLLERTGPPGSEREEELGVFKHGIGSLAPAANVTTLIGTFAKIKEANPTLRYKGTVVFHNSTGRDYESPVSLDLRYMEHNSYIHRKTIHDVVKQLEELQKTIKHIVTGFHKPFVITQDSKDKKAEDEARHKQSIAMRNVKKSEAEGQE